MSNYVPNFEDRYYEVHPSQLRWAMHQLDSVPNYNVRGYASGQGGMYIIVVQVPVGAPQADWRDPQPQRRRWFRFDWFRIGRGLMFAVIAVALAYIAYGLFVDGAPQHTQAAPAPSLWDRIADAVPHGEPVAEPAIEMPWEAAGRQVGEAMDGIGRILTGIVTLLVLGIIAFVAFRVRRAFHR